MTYEKPVPSKSGIINVENGTRKVYWEYFGEGKKEAICLMNGLAMSTKSWHRTMVNVYPEYDVILYDYFGQGQSSKEDEPYYISNFCHYLTQILDEELKIDKIHIMGVSYGGFIAAEYARLYSHRLHTACLSGILLTKDTNFQLYQDISLMFYKKEEPAFEIYTHYLYEKIFGATLASILYGEKLDKMRNGFYELYKDNKHCLIRLTEAQNPFFENIEKNPDAYTKISAPTLIITGMQDRAIPPWVQKKMTNIIPDNKQIEIEECGHMTYMEKPDIFWNELRTFMAKKSTQD